MKSWIFLAGLSLCTWALPSCTKSEQPTTCSQTKVSRIEMDGSKANIRIKNETGMDLCQVLLNSENNPDDAVDGGDIFYGNLPSHQYSAYTAVNGVRELAYIRATTPKATFSLDPSDYVGMDTLAAGKYTFAIRKYTGVCDTCLTLTVIPD